MKIKYPETVQELTDLVYEQARSIETMHQRIEEYQNEIERLQAKLKIAIKALKDIDKGKLPIGNIVCNALEELK